MSNRIYAIGDIHGELDMLRDAIDRIERDGGSDARIVFLGDYVDRGPDSKAVIEFLMKGVAAHRNWVCLTGNHDQMFSMFMEDYPREHVRMKLGYHWLHQRLGGRQTLADYGVQIADDDIVLDIHTRARNAVPRAHIDFLDSLAYSHQEEELLFVHAGIKPGVPLKQQNKDDLLWIRQVFLEDTRTHPFLVVHGHTPVAVARHFGNRVNIDTGAGYGNQLTTVVFEGRDCWVLTNTGRTALVPLPER